MRILLLNPSYPPVLCGVGDYTEGLARALVREQHEVTVVTCEGVTQRSAGPPRVWPIMRDWGVGAFIRSWREIAATRPEVVVSSFPAVVPGRYARLFYLIPGLSKLLPGRPRTTFIVHEFVRTGESERRLLALALFATDEIIAVTEAERDALVKRHPSLARKIVVRHNVPSIAVAPEDPAADERTRAELAPPGRALIAFFGTIWAPAKGFEEVLAAVAATDAQLVVTGSLDPHNDYHAHLAREIERLGIGGRVRWLGYLDNEQVGRTLRAADAVVLPYRGGAESGYTSLLAALVNAAAVITTRGPNTPEWLRDGGTALLVEPQDVAGVAAAIRRLLGEPELAATVRAGARGLSFGWQEIVEAVTAPAASR
jgi:glycosyltransferase involved in cell wall biosynthesis